MGNLTGILVPGTSGSGDSYFTLSDFGREKVKITWSNPFPDSAFMERPCAKVGDNNYYFYQGTNQSMTINIKGVVWYTISAGRHNSYSTTSDRIRFEVQYL